MHGASLSEDPTQHGRERVATAALRLRRGPQLLPRDAAGAPRRWTSCAAGTGTLCPRLQPYKTSGGGGPAPLGDLGTCRRARRADFTLRLQRRSGSHRAAPRARRRFAAARVRDDIDGRDLAAADQFVDADLRGRCRRAMHWVALTARWFASDDWQATTRGAPPPGSPVHRRGDQAISGLARAPVSDDCHALIAAARRASSLSQALPGRPERRPGSPLEDRASLARRPATGRTSERSRLPPRFAARPRVARGPPPPLGPSPVRAGGRLGIAGCPRAARVCASQAAADRGAVEVAEHRRPAGANAPLARGRRLPRAGHPDGGTTHAACVGVVQLLGGASVDVVSLWCRGAGSRPLTRRARSSSLARRGKARREGDLDAYEKAGGARQPARSSPPPPSSATPSRRRSPHNNLSCSRRCASATTRSKSD